MTSISEFIEQTNRLKTPDEVYSLFQKVADGEGCGLVAYGALTNHVIYHARRYEAPAVVLNYPDDWVKYYFEQNYQDIDPIVQLSPGMRSPFVWSDLSDSHDLSAEQMKLMSEASDAGLRSGLTVPIHGPFGEVAVVSVASDTDFPNIRTKSSKFRTLAAQFHIAYTELVLGIRKIEPPVHLTPREQECLLWSAHGKSSWDIGSIIGVSEHTVNFHLKNAMGKLESGSRVVAIVKAIRMGIISP